MFQLLISSDELAQHADTAQILDCRAKLGAPDWGPAAFEQGHIAQAHYVNLDTDLSVAPNEHGRHPLPSQQQWLNRVRALGLRNDAQIVVYDDTGGCFAARAWWMLRWLGHANVAVLDGGLQQWSQALQTGRATPPEISNFTLHPALTRLYSSDQVLAAIQQPVATRPRLVDARSHERFAGKEEPIDPVAGHIPGAICMPFNANLDATGKFKTPAALAKQFASISAAHAVVCYCGSGVTATHNILAARIAGLPEPALYADSWSGWITDPDRPYETLDTS
ncbi:MAG TPA: sulfurtransferase [Gammaproteobacteria bacterium]|nr:sulfurtransferase [Gammaproteobacteria bacterium]HCY05026.1 sulfurtransferase [Gammaproteobacteria bacterium]